MTSTLNAVLVALHRLAAQKMKRWRRRNIRAFGGRSLLASHTEASSRRAGASQRPYHGDDVAAGQQTIIPPVRRPRFPRDELHEDKLRAMIRRKFWGRGRSIIWNARGRNWGCPAVY